jgi:hypothetical protein
MLPLYDSRIAIWALAIWCASSVPAGREMIGEGAWPKLKAFDAAVVIDDPPGSATGKRRIVRRRNRFNSAWAAWMHRPIWPERRPA